MIMNLCPEYWINAAYTVNYYRHSFPIKSKAKKKKGTTKLHDSVLDFQVNIRIKQK